MTRLPQLTPEQIMMIVLTTIIALSAVAQTIVTFRQASFLRASELRNREREQPKVSIALTSSPVDGSTDAEGKSHPKKDFVGFSFTNASRFEITITSVGLDIGVPVGALDWPAHEITFSPVPEYNGTKLSDDGPPHRLRYGEQMTLLYDEQLVIDYLRLHGQGVTPPVRPFCFDSLGNKHSADLWQYFERKHVRRAAPDPGPDHTTWDEWWKRRKALQSDQQPAAIE